MKTENALFILVFVKKDEVAVATEFDFNTAKQIMTETLSKGMFNLETDEGLIFKMDGSGVATPVFNYRAFLSGEPDVYEPSPKKNDAVKVLFQCPKCGGTDGKLAVDEDRDIIMRCRGCDHLEPVS